MTMLLYEKGKSIRPPFLLAFHFDPPEITDERETKWTENAVPESIPTLSDGTAGVRKAKFTLQFSDFALGRTKPLSAAAISTQRSIMWLRQHSQSNPGFWTTPPVLVFTGLKREVGASALFECVITNTTIISKIHAGPSVLARPSLLAFTGVKDNDIIQATVEIELSEKFDPADQNQPQTLAEAFRFGVTEATRQNGGQ